MKTFSRSKIFFVLLIENKRTNAASFFAPKDAPEKLKFLKASLPGLVPPPPEDVDDEADHERGVDDEPESEKVRPV